MKPKPNRTFDVRSQSASVLIIVLWISIGLVSIALYFAHSMTFELRASDNRATGMAADEAIEGAARYVSYVLSNFATNGAVPKSTQMVCEDVPIDDARFWIIGRDPSGTSSTDPYFGLIDEGSKLDLNHAGTNALSYLPDMTADFATAIADWRSTNGVGIYSVNYATLGYTDKNSPFETGDELRLLSGTTLELLMGDDLNRNGVLDANEKSTSGNGQMKAGLLDYTTIYAREPNFHSDGTMLTNVNDQANNHAALRTALQNDLGASRGDQVMTRLGFTTGGGGGGGGSGATTTFTNLLQLYVRSGMTSTEFGQVINDLTVHTNLYTYGRININTASEEVLTALFMGIGTDQNAAESTARSLVTYRNQNPNNLGTVAWIVDALGNTSQIVRTLEGRDLITTRSYQFTADIAAVGAFGRGFRRVKFIFDTSEGTPKILYRQDLSGLGWALGEKARENLSAQATP
jgi:type II secretory pathway component PulK